MFDPIDGRLGGIAYLIGGLFHWPILFYLTAIRSPNLDMVPYNLLRIAGGWFVVVAVVTLPLWWVIGVWNIAVVLAFLFILFLFASVH